MNRTELVATLTETPSADGAEIAALPKEVGYLEIRADLVGDLDPDWLRDRFDGQLLYTLRSRAEGGAFEGGKSARKRRLEGAVGAYDLVDLEGARDLFPELLVQIPESQRLLSWHGTAGHLPELQNRFAQLAATPARFYKLIPTALESADGLRPLALLESLGRDDVVAFSAGEVGAWTRMIAPRLGSALVYGALGEVPGAPGQLSIERLMTDYGLPFLPSAERLFGIVGRPALHSLSPRLHNGAYRALGIPALYVPFHVESFSDFWLDVVEGGSLEILGLPLAGLSVTAPYKEVALAVSGASSPRADYISAANTLVLNEGVWEAETTDPEGVVLALGHDRIAVEGKRAAVVGCGGAGKASAYGLKMAGAEVTLANRGRNRGEKASQELDLPFVPLEDFDPGTFDILVQATSLGHHDEDPLPFDAARVKPGAAVVDLVYGSEPTRLLRAIEGAGGVAVDGRQVLMAQALEQFRLMNGRPLDPVLASEILGLGAES